jgi:hypothetical protein
VATSWRQAAFKKNPWLPCPVDGTLVFFQKKNLAPNTNGGQGVYFVKKKPGRHWQPEYIFEFFKNLVRF